MEVWVLRHAHAEERARSGRDEDRALSEKGRAQAAAVGRALPRIAPDVEAILASPLTRAQETAREAAHALGLEVRSFPPLEPGATAGDVLRELERGGLRSALLVGHQPLLGELVGRMVHGKDGFDLPLRKAALARVSWEPGGRGRLEALLTPKILERLSG